MALHDTCAAQPIRLITLDPGHFHAALVQKSMYPGVDPVVHVYAPPGPDVQLHLDRIRDYNTRSADPTHWVERVYTGAGYLQKMIADKAGNTVILAGNNREKTDYILGSLRAGLNVLADKPMVIDEKGFGELKHAFDTAAAHRKVLYDIMTERYEITSILQRELAHIPAIFGTQLKGDAAQPGIVATSVHRWYKSVSGSVLTRPAWFFDIDQQGEGIVDVMTHLVDLVQWGCFPDQPIDYTKDIRVLEARHWTTDLTLSRFRIITGLDAFPPYLANHVVHDSVLQIYANGEIEYQLKGVYVRTTVRWTDEAPPGGGDTYSSVRHGTKASLAILQDPDRADPPRLVITPTTKDNAYADALARAFRPLQIKYPGITLRHSGESWVVDIPDKYKEGHEAHFARVTEKFLGYVRHHDMPAWEVPGMLAKYYTTTKALQLARANDTLTAGVFPSPQNNESGLVLHGATRDLSCLDIRTHALSVGRSFTFPADNTDHLLIVWEGNVGIAHKNIGPGGVALFAAGDRPVIHQTGASPSVFYLFSFRSRSPVQPARAKNAGPPVVLDWPDLVMKRTDKGESRAIFSRPVAWLGNINMHATTLNAGEISHPQHVHRNEEIILLRSGHVRMHIADGYRDAQGGDLVFLPSGVPHDLENGNTGPCEYFALQWEQ